MKDFHVATPVTSLDIEDRDNSLQSLSEGEDNVSRWKRIAKLAVQRSASQRWGQV